MKSTCFYNAIARVEKILRVQYYYVSPDDRADALHDSILRFLETKDTYSIAEVKHNLPSFLINEDECTLWLSRVAQRTIITCWRKGRNTESISSILAFSQEKIHEVVENTYSCHPNTEIAFDCITALQSLNVSMRECFELHLNGWTFYDIAMQLKISDSCAQKRYQRAKQKLQSTLRIYAVSYK